MGKKLKKDFKERHKASIEREILHGETGITPEESKLKHNDDYRGKIVHDKERFQDKVHKKTSKINDDDNPLGKDLDNDGIIDSACIQVCPLAKGSENCMFSLSQKRGDTAGWMTLPPGLA